MSTPAEALLTDIAVIGMAGRFPGARTVDEFWRNVRDGVESIQQYADADLLAAGVDPELLEDPHYVKAGSPLPDMELFDGSFFGFSPLESSILDPQHRIFLEVSWEALERAGHVPEGFPGAIGIFAGSGHHSYLADHLLTNKSLVRSVGRFLLRHTGNDKDFMVTRVSYLLDLRGPSINIQTACSTSLVAIHAACQSLLNGECDMALAGGVTVELPHRQGYKYEEGEILSPDGHCRAFDAGAQGTVFGSGVGVVVLRRLRDAIRDRDTILAVVKGSAINNDGAQKVGYLAPSVDGVARCISEALAVGSIDPATVSYVEAHGTGTSVGDPIEVSALKQAFQSVACKRSCGIGSVKTNIGHLDTAAGVASFIKVVEALRHRQLPPSLNFAQPNPACELDEGPFYVQSTLADWKSPGPRRAGVTSLGVGGTNAHVVLEEAPPRDSSHPSRAHQLLLVSARTPDQLDQVTENLAAHLSACPTLSLADVAHTLRAGRRAMKYRRAVVTASTCEAPSALRRSMERDEDVVPAADKPRPVVFMFAGGGAQYVNMAAGLYKSEPAFSAAMDECLKSLAQRAPYEWKSLIYPKPGGEADAAEALERPSVGLPALFAVQYAQARMWMAWGIKPSALIGHSMGEYTAAHLSGVLTLEEALHLVLLRGQLFETLPAGAMLSVAMDPNELRTLMSPGLDIAAINAPMLCVASGPVALVDELQRTLAARGVDTRHVRVAVAAHSRMVDPILEEFRAFFSRVTLRPPQVPLLSNATGAWLTSAEAVDPEYWVGHLRHTVRFAEGLRELFRRPWDGSVLLEVGPGRTLASLAQVHPDRPPLQPVLTSARHPDEAGSDVATMLGTLGRLWSHGVSIDWTAFTGNERPHKVPLPTYPFARTRHWIEAVNGRGLAIDPAPASGEGGKRADIGSWFYRPQWQRRRLLQSATETRGGVIIFADENGVGDALAERLRDSRVRIVRSGRVFAREDRGFTVPLDDSAAYVELLRLVVQEDGAPESIIHLLNLSPPAADSPRSRLGETMSRAFLSLLHLAQAIGELQLTSPLQLTVVSSTLQWVSRDDTVEAEKALLLGPVRVIPREYPNVRCQSIDVEYPQNDGERDRILTQLVAEIGVRDLDPVVAYRGADRYVQTFSSVRIEEPLRAASRLRRRGVYLITGGLGGVGLTLADHLARSFQARLILVGRSALPWREQWDNWLSLRPTHDRTSQMIRRVRAMEARGAEVLVASADVANPDDVHTVVNLARKRFGRIDGVFHTAGVLQDGIIQLKDRGTAGRVLDPKVAGTLVLDEALTDPLDFMVLFSSVSALNGLPGQVDYASANAFLDAFAHRSSTIGNRWTLSVNWSAWQEVGMAAAMARELGLVLTPDANGKSEPIAHPLLVRRTHEADAEVYAANLTLERTWILNEHRARDRGVLPGTGYLELVRAAVAQRRKSHTGGTGTDGTVEFRDVVFLRPFVVGPGEARDLQVRLGPALEFSVLSTSPAQESRLLDGVEHAKEHARGRVEWRPAGVPAALPLSAIKERCGRRVEIVAGIERERHMQFGARWNNLRTVHYGTGEALAMLQLPEEFVGDLDDYLLHPALLDMATAGAQPLIEGFDADQHFYVPFSYGRLVMHAALKPNCVSHITYKASGTLPDIPAFDVTIADESGMPLVTISDFVMKRVHDTRVLADDARPVNTANRILEHSLQYGIAPSEGMSVLERILGSGVGPQIIVSPQDLQTFLSLHEAAGAGSETSDRRPEQRRQEGPAYEAPQTPTERRICELLQDLLGIEQVGVRDNFFELGGHSLLAVRLFSQLHKSTRVNLPLATLFEAPTPRLLAARFGDAAPGADDDHGDRTPQPPEETAAPTAVPPIVDNATGPPSSVHRARASTSSRRVWSSLVALQPNGSRPPFFSIHGRGGNVLNYAAFIEHLGFDQPLYGLQCRGLDGLSEPFQSVREMAAAYVEEVRTVQPIGPYFLGGGSMGGTVALEMAQQLQAKGERVALVAMFDTYGPHYFDFYASQEVHGRSGSRTLNAVRHHARNLHALSARAGYDYIHSRASARFNDKYRHWMCSVYRAAGLPLPHNLRYFALERLNVDMLLKYVPETYTGRIVLFRALVQPDGVYQEPMLGWSSIARGPFEVVNIPGTHNNLIEQPILGQRLRIALRQAQQAAESGNA